VKLLQQFDTTFLETQCMYHNTKVSINAKFVHKTTACGRRLLAVEQLARWFCDRSDATLRQVVDTVDPGTLETVHSSLQTARPRALYCWWVKWTVI